MVEKYISFGIMIHVLIKTADENIDNESSTPEQKIWSNEQYTKNTSIKQEV